MSLLSQFTGWRLTAAILLTATLGGCGSNNGENAASVDSILSGAATLDTTDAAAPFTTLPAGVTPVTVSSPAVINFTIKTTDGRPVTGLSSDEIRFAFAKLIPGSPADPLVPGSGESGVWTSYIYRLKTSTAFPAGVWQATTETPASLAYNAEHGYYSYTFSTDITTATLPDTNTLIWDPAAIHRVAIQLQIKDANGATAAVFNPYFDFSFDADDKSVPADADETHVVVHNTSCNSCHSKLAMHGGGRIEPQYCVMCHNPGTTDAVTGNVLDFKVMIHKIHAGKSLTTAYSVGDDRGDLHDYSELGFPQDLRNCTVCHDGTKMDDNGNPLMPQGDNWKKKASVQACGACHDDVDFNSHFGGNFDFIADDGTPDNSACARCHTPTSNPLGVENLHWNQLEENSKNYQFNIENVVYNSSSRETTVSYSLSNPNDGTTYNLTADCVGACTDSNKFYNLHLYVASLTLIGAPNSIADYTYTVNARATDGTDEGGHHYTLTLPGLPDTSVAQPHGTARVVSIGQVLESKILNQATGEIDSGTLVNVPVLNTYQEFAIDGELQPRRMVVSDVRCNNCHGLLGTATDSNTVANAFHSGARNSVQSCPICHNANRASTTLMTDPNGDVLPVFPDTTVFAGRTFNQSYQFKNMIHGIHGGARRSSPYTHGNPPGTVTDYSVEVDYPGLADCTACHEDDSYLIDRSVLGSSVLSTSTTAYDPGTGDGNPNADLLDMLKNSDGLVDPLLLPVFSAKASSCTGCHDSAANREHMRTIGAAAFDQNQAAVALDSMVIERCDECHGSGGALDVKSVHHIK